MPSVRRFALLACLFHAAAAVAAPAAPETFGDVVRFGDDDALHGKFTGFSAESGATFLRKGYAAPFALRADDLDCVEFGTSAAAPGEGADDVQVVFNNGDLLRGKLEEWTPETVTLATWHSGRLTFKADFVRAIRPGKSRLARVVDGVGKLADWRAYNGEQSDGKITADGALAISNCTSFHRALPFPARFKMEMEITGDREALGFTVLGDPTGIENTCVCRSGYHVDFNNGMVSISRLSPQAAAHGEQPKSLCVRPCRLDPRATRIVLLADAHAKTMELQVDGRSVAVFTDPAGFPTGTTMTAEGSSNGVLYLSRLSLAPWAGPVGPVAASPRAQADTAILANGDLVTGTLQGVHGGRAAFKTEFAVMDIPLERIVSIDLGARFKAVPATAVGESKVAFGESDSLTLRLESVGVDKITGQSAIVGPCTIGRASASRIEFNLGAPFRVKRAEEERKREEEFKRRMAEESGESAEEIPMDGDAPEGPTAPEDAEPADPGE